MDRPDQTARRIGDGPLIGASIVVAAIILAWGNSGSEPRYQLAASGAAVVRMDTDSGELIACTPQVCTRVEPPDRSKTLQAAGRMLGK